MARAGTRKKSAHPTLPAGGEVTILLHPKQKIFTDSNKIYRGFVSGVGGGKSIAGAFDLCVKSQPGCLYAIVGPNYRMLSDATFRAFVEVATKLGLWNENLYRRTDNIAILENGAEILFRSGDSPSTLRGPSLSGCWMDECQGTNEEVFSIMIGRLRQGGKQGWLSGTFTPAGKDHWTYRVFGDETNPNVTLVHASTRDNPFNPPEYYENLLFQYGKGEGGMLRARQELEGEFVCVEGAEWPQEWFGPQVMVDDWPHDDNALRVVMLDSSKGIGGKSGDYSCFAMLMYSRGMLYFDFDMDNTRNASGMASRAIEIQKEFKPDWFGIESEFGGSVLADDLLNRAEAARILMPVVLVPTHGTQKEVRIRKLTPYLAQDMIRFKRSEGTKIALTQFESFPHSAHDDAPDSGEGAIRILNESGAV
jgi:PBSX family phage terminase large subunit